MTNNIRSIRKRLGLSQEAFGLGIGCSQGNVGHYEKGQEVPPPVARKVIAFARENGLDLTFDDIYVVAAGNPDSQPAIQEAA